MPGAATVAGTGSPLWYLSRGSGVLVLVLLTVVVVLGVLARRGAAPGSPTFVLAAVHRNASLLAVSLLAVHVGTAVLDPYASITLVDAVVPFASTYRPVWLGLGALALDLVIALVLTSLLRPRIGRRWWRGVHWLAYLAWPLAVVHGAGTGSDTRSAWNLLIVAACVLTVAAAVLVRARIIGRQAPGLAGAVQVVAVGGPLLFGLWLLTGPLQPGWAARSGTPPALLAHTRQTSQASTPTPAAFLPSTRVVSPRRATVP